MKKILFTMMLTAGTTAYSENFIESPMPKKEVAAQSTIKDLRPAEKERLFRSEAVEKQILDLKSKLTAIDPKLYWMFVNCFPITLDTTEKGKEKVKKEETEE